MNSKILIIAGMHRSGTSLITQWLYRCGLPIGSNLFPADVGNVEGHFEDTDFLEMHRQFLVTRHCPDTGFVDKGFAAITAAEKKQVSDLLEAKKLENDEWGWKEPRTCLFLDLYHDLVPGAFYLFIVRDFRSTINSLLSREYKVHMKKFGTKRGLSRLKWTLFKKKPIEKIYSKHAERFLKIWIHYYEQILQMVRLLPEERYQFVRYASLAEDDTNVFTRLRQDWLFSLSYVPFNEVYKKELLSEVRNIDQYIHDKSLIEKANRIEKDCSKHIKTYQYSY